MTTLQNALGLFAITLLRFGGRGPAGLIWMLFGLAIISVLVWALTRPGGKQSAGN